MIRSLSHARAREREIEGTSLREERNSGIRSLKIPRHPLAPWSRSNALTLIETRYEGVAYILLYCHMWRNTRRRTIASRCVTLGEKKKGEMKEEYKPCRGGARCYSTLYSHYRPCCPYLEIYMDRCIGARCMRACKRKKRVSRPKLSRPLFFFAVSVFAWREEAGGELRENRDTRSFFFLTCLSSREGISTLNSTIREIRIATFPYASVGSGPDIFFDECVNPTA